MESFESEEIQNPPQTSDGPQPYNFEPPPYNFEPPRRETDEEPNRNLNNSYRRNINIWCEENQWRVGQVSW